MCPRVGTHLGCSERSRGPRGGVEARGGDQVVRGLLIRPQPWFQRQALGFLAVRSWGRADFTPDLSFLTCENPDPPACCGAAQRPFPQ